MHNKQIPLQRIFLMRGIKNILVSLSYEIPMVSELGLFFEWLLFPVSQTSPQPFQWTKTEIPQPDMTPDDFDDPYSTNNIK